MSTGLVYRSARLYRLAMRLLDGRAAAERRRRVVDAIPPGSDVVDLCCGPAEIAAPLGRRGCRYTGLDVNPVFVEHARRRGIDARVWDAEREPIPGADVVCMLSSLYQFIPDDREIVRRMVASARRLVVVSEPVRNWASSGSPLLRRLARSLTRVNGRTFPERHTEESLRALVADLPGGTVELTRVGREVLLVIRPRP